MPNNYEDKLIAFQQFIIKHRKKLQNYDLNNIGNVDQTPIYFDMPTSTTMDVKGSKTITIKTAGNEKNRFTCMLPCMADGTKLSPYVI